MKIKTLAESFTHAGILKEVSVFFYNAHVRLEKATEDTWNISTHKGLESSVRVRKNGSKYIFERMV